MSCSFFALGKQVTFQSSYKISFFRKTNLLQFVTKSQLHEEAAPSERHTTDCPTKDWMWTRQIERK